MDTSDLISSAAVSPAKRIWHRYDDAFRARVIEQARQPHTCVAAVVLANGLNANMLRRWVREAEAVGALAGPAAPLVAEPAPRVAGEFVQLPCPMPTREPVVLEITCGATAIQVTLPAGIESAAWVREVLR